MFLGAEVTEAFHWICHVYCLMDNHTRDRMIGEAVKKHGYSQMEVARYWKLHYSAISRRIKGVTTSKGKDGS